jgi:Protein of unknown function (DUF998)
VRKTEEPRWTRPLLLCGGVAGPLFLLVVLLQDYSIPAFDPRVHLLSQLSLGRWGWIQILNFTLAGILNILYAAGLRNKARCGEVPGASYALIGIYGCCLVIAGIFTTDPANGFPPGILPPSHPSGHAVVHALVTFTSLIASLAVFAYRFLRKHHWLGYYCGLSLFLMTTFFFGSFPNATFMARFLRLSTLIGWMAASVVAITLVNASQVAAKMEPNKPLDLDASSTGDHFS